MWDFPRRPFPRRHSARKADATSLASSWACRSWAGSACRLRVRCVVFDRFRRPYGLRDSCMDFRCRAWRAHARIGDLRLRWREVGEHGFCCAAVRHLRVRFGHFYRGYWRRFHFQLCAVEGMGLAAGISISVGLFAVGGASVGDFTRYAKDAKRPWFRASLACGR